MNKFILSVLCALLGVGGGLWLRPQLGPMTSAVTDAGEADHHEDHDDSHHEELIELSAEAYQSLGVQTAKLQTENYQVSIRVPAQVAELPGVSASKLAAPVAGVVTRVLSLPGMSVEPGDALFVLRVIDERAVEAQVELLETLTQIEIAESELARLGPLANSGAVSQRRPLELEYQKKGLLARIDRLGQELLMRGMPADQLEALRQNRRLQEEWVVRLPDPRAMPSRPEELSDDAADGRVNVQLAAWTAEDAASSEATVEELLVAPGQSVARGDALCDLAHHTNLYLVAAIFPDEVDAVIEAANADLSVEGEFTGADGAIEILSGLPIRYVANHVDPATQTYEAYIALPNKLLRETTDPSTNQRYRTWKYKVGQRAHVKIPVKQIVGKYVLPVEAVVSDGADNLVFRRPTFREHASMGHHHGEEEPFAEFLPIPVAVVHRGVHQVVVEPSEKIAAGAEVVVSAAYPLYLVKRTQAEGGAGHDHGHGHDH